MRKYSSYFLFILFFLSCIKILAQKTFADQITDYFSDEITEDFLSNMKPFEDSTELAIAVIKNGEKAFFGCQKINGSLLNKENKSHIFEIGSITKVFTSTLLANAVIENKVLLDQNIASFFNYPFHKNIELTFLSLANHTSGLPRLSASLMKSSIFNNNPYKEFDDEHMEKYLKDQVKLSYIAGEKSEYSNMGAGILGFAMEQVYGTSLDDLFQEKIFHQYDMNNSTILLAGINGVKTEARDANGKITPYWEWDALAGAGGIYSSVDQLVNFAKAQMDPKNEELHLTQKETYRINDKISLGLGWHIVTAKDGRKILWHNGGTSGSTSYMAVDLEKKNAVIILSNVSAFHHKYTHIDNLGFALLKELAN